MSLFLLFIHLAVKQTCEFVDNSKSSDGTAALISTELQDDGLQVCNIHLVYHVNPLECSDIRWLHLKLFGAIPV